VDVGGFGETFGHLEENRELASVFLSGIRLARELGPNSREPSREQDLRSYLGTFNFTGDMVKQSVGSMSGGEKARLVLAMIVWQRPNLLLLDEPTNHLDLPSQEILQAILSQFQGTILLVEDEDAVRLFCARALRGKGYVVTETRNGEAALALLAQDQFLRLPVPGSRHALSQFRHELAGLSSPDQATQVGERAGMHRPCLHPGTQLVEQGLGLLRAGLEQEERRRTFFREQAFRQDQVTTTLWRPTLVGDGFPGGWLLY